MLLEYLLIGEVLRPQGVKGLVKVRPDTDDPYRYEDLDFVFVKKGNEYEKMEIADVNVRDDGVYLRLNGIQDRNEAEKQRGMMLYVDRAHARKLEEGETFICDLLGCKVIDFDKNEIGVVKDVLQPGGNDVYVIKTPKGEMLLPAVRHIVPEIDVEKGIMKVDASRLHEVAVCSWE